MSFDLVTKPILTTIAILLAIAALAMFVWLGIREIHAMVKEAADRAEQTAIEMTDAKWTAKLEKANAETNRKLADNAVANLKIQATASEQVRQAEKQLEDSERQIAVIADDGSCGLSAERGRVLPK